MARERCSFATNAFHQVAVRTHGVDVEIEDLKARPVEICRQPPAGHGDSHTVSHALTKRPSRGLNPGGEVRFGMSRSPAAELPEALDLLHGNRERFENLPVL